MPEINVAGRVFLLDADDVQRIEEYTWGIIETTPNHVYAATKINGKTVGMARFIASATDGSVVDHVNGNTLDNRKENLRICTHAENMRNRKTHKNNKTGLKGVYYDKCRMERPYRAQIRHGGKKINLGGFPTPEQAHAAYVKAAKELHKEFFNPG